jgi:hypothetical protein
MEGESEGESEGEREGETEGEREGEGGAERQGQGQKQGQGEMDREVLPTKRASPALFLMNALVQDVKLPGITLLTVILDLELHGAPRRGVDDLDVPCDAMVGLCSRRTAIHEMPHGMAGGGLWHQHVRRESSDEGEGIDR